MSFHCVEWNNEDKSGIWIALGDDFMVAVKVDDLTLATDNAKGIYTIEKLQIHPPQRRTQQSWLKQVRSDFKSALRDANIHRDDYVKLDRLNRRLNLARGLLYNGKCQHLYESQCEDPSQAIITLPGVNKDPHWENWNEGIGKKWGTGNYALNLAMHKMLSEIDDRPYEVTDTSSFLLDECIFVKESGFLSMQIDWRCDAIADYGHPRDNVYLLVCQYGAHVWVYASGKTRDELNPAFDHLSMLDIQRIVDLPLCGVYRRLL